MKGQIGFNETGIFHYVQKGERTAYHSISYQNFITNNLILGVRATQNKSISEFNFSKSLRLALITKYFLPINKKKNLRILGGTNIELAFFDYNVDPPLFESSRVIADLDFGLAYFFNKQVILEIYNSSNLFVRRGGFSFFENIAHPDINISLSFFFNKKNPFNKINKQNSFNPLVKNNLIINGLIANYKVNNSGYGLTFMLNSRFFIQNNFFGELGLIQFLQKRNEENTNNQTLLSVGTGYYFFNKKRFKPFFSINFGFRSNNNPNVLTPNYNRNDFQVIGKIGFLFLDKRQGLTFSISKKATKPYLSYQNLRSSHHLLHYNFVSLEYEFRLTNNVSPVILVDYLPTRKSHSLGFSETEEFYFFNLEQKRNLELSLGFRYYIKAKSRKQLRNTE